MLRRSGHFSVLARLPNKSPYPEEKYEGREQPPRLQYASAATKGALVLTLEGGHSLKRGQTRSPRNSGRASNSSTVLVGEDMEPQGKQGRGLEETGSFIYVNRFLMSTV